MTREESMKWLDVEIRTWENECQSKHPIKEALYAARKALEQKPKTGHWIEHPHECGINWEYPMYECSECHGWTEDDSDFCPDCGADMREVKE